MIIKNGKSNWNFLLIVVALAIIVVGGIFWFAAKQEFNYQIPEIKIPEKAAKEGTADWKTYINEEFGYSINYPSSWTFREFPDIKSGAGFRPLSSPEEIRSECIYIDAAGTAESEYDTPFDEYVRKAAIVEIQDTKELNSIETVTTTSGLVGYKTTWIYNFLGTGEKISLPITFFDNKKTVQTKNGRLKYKTVHITLENKDCEEIYSQMLSTFKLIQ